LPNRPRPVRLQHHVRIVGQTASSLPGRAAWISRRVNIVFGGKTPDPGREAFAEMGFSIVLYANTVLQAALRGAYAALGSLKKEGDLSAAGDLLASFEERQRSVAKHEWDALEARYRLPG
jgi:2-methylisocitrate lyase-like PEP mutase family enzyme